MKNKKIIILLIIITVFAVGFFFLPKKTKDPKKLEITEVGQDLYAFTTMDDNLIEIKDEDGAPKLSMEKWNQEAKFNLKMPYEITSEAENNGERLSWNTETKNPGESREVVFNVLEPTEKAESINGEERNVKQFHNGGVKFDILLEEEPRSNTFEFEIDSENLDFYYQEILTEEEMEEKGTFRPENVMGSYAAYHDSKANNKYKTGKAFHIYRPLIYDSEGEEIWGELNIDEDEGLLTVEVDEDWLSQASYPVTIDPTFGYDEVGSSDDDRNLSMLVGTRDEAVVGGDLDKLYAYFQTIFGDAEFARGGLYSSDRNFIEQTEENGHKTEIDPDWYEYPFDNPPSINENKEYFIVFTSDAGMYEAEQHYYYDDAPSAGVRVSFDYSEGDDLPDSFSDEDEISRKYSIYATYETEEETDFPESVESGYFIEKDGSNINLFAPNAETKEISTE